MAFWTTQVRQCLRYCAQTRADAHIDTALPPRRVPLPLVSRNSPIENATAISLVGSFPTATFAKFYIPPPPPPARTPWREPAFQKGLSTRKSSLVFLWSLLSVPMIAVLIYLFFKSCHLANYLFVDLPRRKKAKQKWKDSTKGMDEKQLATRGRMAEARTQLYGYVRDCEQTISMKEYNCRDQTKFFRGLEKDNKRTQRQKELRVQRNLQSVVRHDFGPSEYVVVDLEHQEKTAWTVYDTYIDNSHPTSRRAIVITVDGPPTQDTSPSSSPCTAESSLSSSSSGVSESFSLSSPSPSLPCSAQSSSSPCCVDLESSLSSSPASSPSYDQCSPCYSSSTVTECSTPQTDDHGASRAIVPRTFGKSNVRTPSLAVPPSTPTGSFSLPIDNHGTPRAIVPQASRNTNMGTPSIIQPSSLSTIVEESSSSGASGSQRKGVPGTALAKYGSCRLCRTRDLAPPPPPSPCSSGSSSWSSSCSCSYSSTSSSATPSPPIAKPPSNTPVRGSAASRRGAGKSRRALLFEGRGALGRWHGL